MSVPIIRSRIVENSRKVCTPRKILHFAYASFSRMTNELALLVVQTNASVTSRGGGVRGGEVRAHFESAPHPSIVLPAFSKAEPERLERFQLKLTSRGASSSKAN